MEYTKDQMIEMVFDIENEVDNLRNFLEGQIHSDPTYLRNKKRKVDKVEDILNAEIGEYSVDYKTIAYKFEVPVTQTIQKIGYKLSP